MGMKPIGFTLEEINDVLNLLERVDVGDTPAEVWERLEMYAALAVERREKYRRKLELATDFTTRLQATCAAGRANG